MVTITDPAREFTEFLQSLLAGGGREDVPADEYIGTVFEVVPWTRDFTLILYMISERNAYLTGVVDILDMDDELKLQAKAHLSVIDLAFRRDHLCATWRDGAKKLIETHITPIQMMSASVRPKISYPKFSEDESSELIAQLDQLLSWLAELQLVENDFVRQGLIEGLLQLRFRILRLRWLGWGYAQDGLKNVIAAYMALQFGVEQNEQGDPIVKAIVAKTGAIVKSLMTKINAARGLKEDASFVLSIYREAGPYVAPYIAGLLTAGIAN